MPIKLAGLVGLPSIVTGLIGSVPGAVRHGVVTK